MLCAWRRTPQQLIVYSPILVGLKQRSSKRMIDLKCFFIAPQRLFKAKGYFVKHAFVVLIFCRRHISSKFVEQTRIERFVAISVQLPQM